MKRMSAATACMCAGVILPALAITSTLAKDMHESGEPAMKAVLPPEKSSQPQRVITLDGFLYENFESVPDESNSLPEGWTATSTPGLDDDTWHAGTLGRDGTPMNGVSGYKYAYILGNRTNGQSHDAWLFSPSLQMEAGTEYSIEFFAIMPPVMGDDILEKMEVYVCSSADASATVLKLDEIENDNDYWRYYSYSFTPETNGEYLIGFHSVSPAKSNSTAIDDLKISSGPVPIFSGSAELDLGTTDMRKKHFSASYRISNGGKVPLEVSLASASEGVSVEGLPVTVDDYDDAYIEISAVPETSGDYSGTVTLATNDPTLPTVEIKLSGSVKDARVTGYNFEDFETGGPEGWDLSFGSGNVALYGGHNSTRAYYTTTVYYDDSRNKELNGVGFTTHYVEMGPDPVISFWYQMAKVDFSGNVTGPAESGDVSVNVLLSEDNGLTYNSIYLIEPGGEHEHTATLDWTQVTVPVPEYADKTCRLRVVFNQPSGPSFFNQVRCMADDVEIGTKVTNDLRATSLTGNALVNAGSQYEYTATVENLGEESVSDYKVELVDADSNEVIYTADGTEVAASEKATVKLLWTPAESGYVRLNARIVSESDPNADNDLSYTHHVQVLPENNTPISVNHGEALAAMSFPVNFYVVESATQSIYLANEIGTTKGDINSIAFTSYLDADFYGEPFCVYIAETDKNDFSDGEFIDPASFTKVFEGSIYMQAGTRDFVIPFDTPFSYNGGNIVVMCEKIGKEFVMGKYFVVHKCEGFRSIQTSSYQSGTIAANGYADATPSEVYPEIRFNIVKAPAGKVTGTVTDESGPVSDVLVRISGTQRTEVTDTEGKFSFDEIAAGPCVLEASKHGYYTLTDTRFELAEGNTEQRDLTIRRLPRHAVSGTVTSAETNEPIRNAKVEIKGYDDYSGFTDNNGIYVFESMAADTGSSYTLKVSDSYFHSDSREIDVDGDKTADFSLREKTLKPHDVKANVTGSGVLVTWGEPLPEFRYDSGEPVDYVGWTHGLSETIVGTAFRNKAVIKEISWYVTDRFGAHENFNVYIFGLDEEGNPNPKDILYVAKNVEYKDNEWSSHILGNPVEADGFMIAVSCDGFLGIGICEPTDEYPFEEGQCYYAGDSFNMTISNMSSFAKVHPMLRAYGEDLDTTNGSAAGQADSESIDRPAVEYKVFRCRQDAGSDEWELIETTSGKNLLDTEGETDNTPFTYAVIASYASGESAPTISNEVSYSGLSSIEDLGINITLNPADGTLRLYGNDLIANMTLVSGDGIAVVSADRPSDQIDISDLGSGVYVCVITLNDGSRHSIRFIKN